MSAPSAPTESDPSFNTRGVHTVFGFSKNWLSGPAGEKIVELLVVELAALQRLLSPAPGNVEPRAEVIDGVHRPRVVDVVGRHQRGVHRARPIGVHELVHEVFRVGVVDEQPVDPHVLRADDRAQIGPFRTGRIGRRVGRTRADMAEPAGHPDPVGTHQVLSL